jgi:hypothetical protein
VKNNFDVENVYKIGITENLRKRISDYRCGIINEPALMYYFPCKDISICDEVMKRNLLKLKVKREIYEGDLTEIRRILESSLNSINDGEVYCFEPEFKEKDVSECIFCKKIFCSKGKLYDHIKNCTAKEIINGHQCRYCKREFTRSDSLNKHLLSRCKVKKQQDSEKEDLLQKLVEEMKKQNEEIRKQNEEMQKQSEEMQKQSEEMQKHNEKMAGMQEEIIRLKSENKKYVQKIGSQQNNNTKIDQQQNIQINNNHLNIKLLAFGNEDMSHLVDSVYKKILNKGFKSVPTLVNFVHFNRNKPQNHNVYISNIQTNYALVYDGDDWKLKERDDVLRQLIDDLTAILSDKFDELSATLDEHTIKKFKRFLGQKNESEVAASIKNEIKLMLYNNKKIPEKTRALLNSANEHKMLDV